MTNPHAVFTRNGNYMQGFHLSSHAKTAGKDGFIAPSSQLRLLFFTNADCMLSLGGHLYALSAGSVIVLLPDQPAQFLYGQQAQFQCICWDSLGQDPLSLESQLARLRRGLVHLRLGGQELTGLWADLIRLQELQAMGEGEGKAAYARSYDVMVKLVAHSKTLVRETAAPMSASASLANDVKAYLDLAFHEPQDIARLANHFFVSPSHLSRAFKMEMGRTIMTYINDLRVDRAATLLRSGFSCTHARESAGFGSAQHFIKQFKLRLQVSPSLYRRQYGNAMNGK